VTLLSHWRLGAHQQLSPALVDKLEFFATVRGSYEAAARLVAKVGCLVALDGSGPVQVCVTWMLWKKRGITAIGIISGSPTNGARLRLRPIL